MTSLPLTIPISTQSSVIVSEIFNSETIIADNISDGIATLSEGYLSNLVNSTNLQNVATKEQVEGSVISGGVNNSIQFNNNELFSGTSNFTFDGTTLNLNGTFQDQTGMTIQNGTISNVTNPVDNNDIATKAYVDSLDDIVNLTNINSDTGVTWTAISMYGIIVRNSTDGLASNLSVMDTTPTAAEIIGAYTGVSQINTSFRFMLINNNIKRLVYDNLNTFEDDDMFKVSFQSGVGVSISPSGSFIIPRTHTMDSFVVFNNVTPGFEAVTIYINSIDWFPKSFFFKPSGFFGQAGFFNYLSDINITKTQITTGVSVNISGNYFSNMDLTNKSDINYVYNDEVSKGIVVRTPNAPSSDSISNNIINKVSINQLFRIVNQGTSDITLSPIDTMSEIKTQSTTLNNVVIQAGYTGLFGIQINKNQVFTQSPSIPGSNYTVGPCTVTTNGSGIGMTAIITDVKSGIGIISPGTGYVANTVYNTSTLVGSGSGLKVKVFQVGGGGEILIYSIFYSTSELIDMGYTNGSIFTISGGSGVAGQVFLNVIYDFLITDFGTGYEIGDTITLTQGINSSNYVIQEKYFTIYQFGHTPN